MAFELWDISREVFPGNKTQHFIGINEAVPNGTWVDIYPTGTDYPFQTAAQTLEILSDDANDSGVSTGILTLAANFTDTETFTIGSRTYTLQTTLTNVDGNIHIDSTAALTILNIVDAIILGSGGEGVGVGYATATTINTSVSAADGTGDTIDFTSLSTFPIANDGDLEVLATTETGANSSFGAVAMVHPTGAQCIEIHGLNSTGVDTEEIVCMNGTTAVILANTYIRINNIHLQTVGSQQGGNFDNITLQVQGGGDVLSQIFGFETGSINTKLYGHGEDNNGIYSIPLNRIAYLTSIEIIVTGTKAADVVLYEAEGVLRNASPFLPRRVLWQGFDLLGSLEHKFDSFIKIKPLTDIWFRGQGSGATTSIAVRLDWLEGIPDRFGK